MISINSALEVDLLGRFAPTAWGRSSSAEWGAGGFCSRSPDVGRRKAIIALPSTAKEFSRIVPIFKQGAAVTTSRNDVDYIVTDCGIAALAGKTIRQRMKAIIEIATRNSGRIS